MLKNCDTAKHVSIDGQFLKYHIAKFSVFGDSFGLLSTKILLPVFQIAFWFLICCRCDSLLILLVVGFDDLSYCQENIRSKFKDSINWFRFGFNAAYDLTTLPKQCASSKDAKNICDKAKKILRKSNATTVNSSTNGKKSAQHHCFNL